MASNQPPYHSSDWAYPSAPAPASDGEPQYSPPFAQAAAPRTRDQYASPGHLDAPAFWPSDSSIPYSSSYSVAGYPASSSQGSSASASGTSSTTSQPSPTATLYPTPEFDQQPEALILQCTSCYRSFVPAIYPDGRYSPLCTLCLMQHYAATEYPATETNALLAPDSTYASDLDIGHNPYPSQQLSGSATGDSSSSASGSDLLDVPSHFGPGPSGAGSRSRSDGVVPSVSSETWSTTIQRPASAPHASPEAPVRQRVTSLATRDAAIGRRAKHTRRLYTCTYCPTTFTKRHNLDGHIRSHLGERPFACRSCGRRFTRDADRRRHERDHCRRQPPPPPPGASLV